MVTLLYFAQVREAVGRGSATIDLPDGIATAGDLVDWLAQRYPVFANRSRLHVAIDQVMAGFDTTIGSAREIAFFPPVTGG